MEEFVVNHSFAPLSYCVLSVLVANAWVKTGSCLQPVGKFSDSVNYFTVDQLLRPNFKESNWTRL